MDLTNRVAIVTGGARGLGGAIAAVAAFLASDRAAYLTGETVDVNGGLHMD